jgi:DNA topoisomerase-2
MSKSKKSTSNDSGSDSDSKDSIEKKFQKFTTREHVLKKPNMYIGSIDPIEEELWTYDDEEERLVFKKISYVPGLFKIFDEVLVNASDQSKKEKTCKCIKTEIDQETGEISVWNDGPGIPIIKHTKYNVMIPELLFGSFRTSTNYDETEKRTWGGTNGYGAKLANVYSTEFIVETVDNKRKKKYIQKFHNNMSKKDEPKITSCDSDSYVKITLTPDYKKFGLDGITDDIYSLLKKRVYDISAITNKNVKVFFNKKLVGIKGMKNYIDYFYSEDTKLKKYYEEPHNRWRIGVVYDRDLGYFNQISYVNGISTSQGGTHVDYIINQICNKLKEIILAKHKDLKIKTSQIKENLTIFLDCDIDNPTFSSQTKTHMTLPPSKFGSKCVLEKEFINKIAKSGIVEEVIKFATLKQMGDLKKTDGNKKNDVSDIPKLEDAYDAGTKNSEDTVLILTEGDSARSFAMSALAVVGRKKYGVFPLKGKPLNVRQAPVTKIMDNVEITYLKRIIGLKHGVEYKDTKALRYGHIMILTDQDLDGFHIKGLIINFVHFGWESLLKNVQGFLVTLATPLIKATKGKGKKEELKVFYSELEYHKWLEGAGDNKLPPKGWRIKYYKGLGTHKAQEARECFKELSKKIISYNWEKTKKTEDSESESESDSKSSDSDDDDEKKVSKPKKKVMDPNNEAIILGFDKKLADLRKKWLNTFNKNIYLDNSIKKVTIPQFINKELIQFSNGDNIRSIPSVIDGQKPSLRKALYGGIKINLIKESKLSEVSSDIMKATHYHHGEASMTGTLIGMAQNFIGSNNINLYYPAGQFGTRIDNGGDAASPRYIFTRLETITKYIFKMEDMPVLTKQYDDGKMIEPETFAPIIPMLLVNGTIGIGTGYSTNIPMYNPKDIINNLLKKINDGKFTNMIPWYRGFLGNVKKVNDSKYEIIAKYEIDQNDILHIIDLPVGMSSNNYDAFLTSLKTAYNNQDEKGSKKLSSLKLVASRSLITDVNAEYYLYFEKGSLKKMIGETEADELAFIKKLKLVKSITTTNMHAYTKELKIKKYNNTVEILSDYYEVRLEYIKLKN